MRNSIVVVAALVLVSTFNSPHGFASPPQSAPAAAAQPHDHGAVAGPEAKTSPMADMRSEMMAKMNATDADLNGLVANMKAAEGAAKTAIMADLLTRLVQQQTTTRAQMNESMKTMMAQCSMMKEPATHDGKPEH